jgi:hypothetical protein
MNAFATRTNSMTRFIDDFDVILLDMGNTFMFGCDRFGQSVDSSKFVPPVAGGLFTLPPHS